MLYMFPNGHLRWKYVPQTSWVKFSRPPNDFHTFTIVNQQLCLQSVVVPISFLSKKNSDYGLDRSLVEPFWTMINNRGTQHML